MSRLFLIKSDFCKFVILLDQALYGLRYCWITIVFSQPRFLPNIPTSSPFFKIQTTQIPAAPEKFYQINPTRPCSQWNRNPKTPPGSSLVFRETQNNQNVIFSQRLFQPFWYKFQHLLWQYEIVLDSSGLRHVAKQGLVNQ